MPRGARHGQWHRTRRLRGRLFFWFTGAIVLAIASSSLTVWLTRPEPTEGPVRVVSRNIQHHLARDWEDPHACDAYVKRLEELTGLELRIRRDPEALPAHVRRVGGRGGTVAFSRDGHGYIPIAKSGAVVGAVEFDAGGSVPPHLWRIFAALGVALLVLAAAAVRVSRRIARPLEEVARAAERFGAGDLSVRTRMSMHPRRWVSDEMAEVGVAFDRMAERIEGIVRDQRELLAAISHELRSPLGRARVALEIARERTTGTGPFDDLENQLAEIDAILGDLLAAARAGLSDLRTEETRLVPWLRAKIAAEPTPPTIELTADAAEEVELRLDPALLGRALHNLLANARNHGHPGDVPLEVRVERTPAGARLVVRDRGPGFTAELLARAFEPFVRGDAARSPGHGTGLGLALVRRIAEAHGGRAFARNADGGGAEVGMELPRGLEPEARPL
jgi:signal transduction histidine kinase